jgi:hypothetical protein
LDGDFYWEVLVTYVDRSGAEDRYLVPVKADAQVGELLAPLLAALGKSDEARHVMEVAGSLDEPEFQIREV